MKSGPDLPVVVFGYNRPMKFAKILNSLRSQSIRKIIIYIDGPRNKKDLKRVNECQLIAKEIKWVDTDLRFREQNLGSKSLDQNISEVMEEYPAAIFLEDDCLPMPGFMSFMKRAVFQYESCPEVFSIGAYQPIGSSYFAQYPYALVGGTRFMGWGWATWREKWEEIKPLIDRAELLFQNEEHFPTIAGPELAQAFSSSETDSSIKDWDYRVIVATLFLKKIHLLPVCGLVRNIGMDRSGMHGSYTGIIRDMIYHNRNLANELPAQLQWPEKPRINCEYANELIDWIVKSRQFSLNRLLRRFGIIFGRYLYPGWKRIYNQGIHSSETKSLDKNALLSYIVHPFSIPRDDPRYYNHINIHHSHEIVRVLNGMGYSVDVIDYRDKGGIPPRIYDLFIGHGGENFSKIIKQLPEKSKKIYFATTSYWQIHNKREVKRFDDLKKRRNIDLPYDRLLPEQDDQILQKADGILGIGNESTRETYKKFKNVVMIDGSALYDDHFDWCQKNYNEGRENFLFFSSGGSIHKGLDLLLDAFLNIPSHLWIVSRVENKFYQHFKNELTNLSNIHFVGWTRPRSRAYYQVVWKCNWCILPSCSEGQAQSVLEGMCQGLIPVVTRETGLEITDIGYFIENPSVEEIKKLIIHLSQLPLEECERRSQKARQISLIQYSSHRFAQNLQRAVEKIINE